MSIWNGKYVLLVRRELWEHRTLWLAPAAVALLIVILPMFGNFSFGSPGRGAVGPTDMSPQTQAYFSTVLFTGVASVLGVAAAIVSLVYLLDCLFAERKDRSILFWKSLPVSDAETVLTKLGVVLVVVPVMTLAMALLCYCLMAGMLPLRYENLSTVFDLAHVGRGFAVLPSLANNWLFTLLWFAPGAAYLMLASVLAKRAPLAYAVLPPVVLVMIEQLLLDSNYVGGFLQGWITPWAQAMAQSDPENPFGRIGRPDWAALLQEPYLWLGLAAAAVMVYMVIRLRRYRDDT